jgi:hypothetical protein
LAAQKSLQQPAIRRAQTERMLKHPKAARFVENFTGQWLDLREIDFTTPDRMLYPEFDELLQISMVQETQRFFRDILDRDSSVLNFVNSEYSIINERLAKHYGISDVSGQEFRRVKFSEGSHRGGVLTHASVLKVSANGTNTSPVLRGVWVLDKILGQPVPLPPANVPAVEPDIRGAVTIREQLAKHREVDSCASCHRKIDPPGFALESFDVIGGWRTNYRSVGDGEKVSVLVNGRGVRYKRGLPVDAAGQFTNGDRFENIDEFKEHLLKDKEEIARSVTEKLMMYATGGGMRFSDRVEVDEIVTRMAKSNYGLRTLIHEVVQSEVFS